MIQITAQMRVLVAIESVDGRKGIDSLARLCQEKLSEDSFSGCVFVFLIHTCQLCGANSLEYLVELQRHGPDLAANAAAWMLWTYREALAQVGV